MLSLFLINSGHANPDSSWTTSHSSSWLGKASNKLEICNYVLYMIITMFDIDAKLIDFSTSSNIKSS